MAHLSYLLPLRAAQTSLPALVGLLLACSPKADTPTPKPAGPAASGTPAATGTQAPAAEPAVDDPKLANPAEHFAPQQGWVELTPPLHLPSTDPKIDSVRVLARFTPSDRAQLKLESHKDGPRLQWPVGSELARLEYLGSGDARRLASVAITKVGPERALLHQAADLSAGGEFGGVHRPTPASECAGCHKGARPANLTSGQHGTVDKGSDAQGFFTPQSVFADLVALESYGEHDPNLGNPYVGFGCSSNAPPVTHKPEGAARRVTCPTGIPVARYDLAKALQAGDAWAAKVCASRLALHQRMDEQAKAHFAKAMQSCAADQAPAANQAKP